MTVDVATQLRKGVVESCILGLLEREPMYGWQLSETLVGQGMIASIGSLYPILSRLKAQQLVSSYEVSSDAGPTRKYYRLTPAGERHLDNFRQQWASFAPAVATLTATTQSAKDASHD